MRQFLDSDRSHMTSACRARTGLRPVRGAAATLVLALGVWGIGHTPLAAQSAKPEAEVPMAECDVVDVNGATVVMVCPKAAALVEAKEEGLTALKKAGEAACIGTAPCIAWIWDDAANAPEKAPPLSDGLTREQVQSAIAIWVNDAGQILTISAKKRSG